MTINLQTTCLAVVPLSAERLLSCKDILNMQDHLIHTWILSESNHREEMQTIIRHTVDTMAPSGLIRFPLGLYIGFPTVFIAGMVCALCIITGPVGCLSLLSTPSKHEIHFLKLGVLMALYSKAHLENVLVSMICGCESHGCVRMRESLNSTVILTKLQHCIQKLCVPSYFSIIIFAHFTHNM